VLDLRPPPVVDVWADERRAKCVDHHLRASWLPPWKRPGFATWQERKQIQSHLRHGATVVCGDEEAFGLHLAIIVRDSPEMEKEP
jgi:hypothetical protein